MPDRPTKWIVVYTMRSVSHASAPLATKREAEALAKRLRADGWVKPGSVKVWRCDRLAEVGR